MLALSVRQPWAWMIFHCGKDIENRNWATKVRGRVLIHAAKTCTFAEYSEADYFAQMYCGVDYFPTFSTLELGGIIGSVEIVDCVTRSASNWFMGKYGFVLRDPQPLPFRPMRGQLGFFEVEHDG